jgi:hypothetical protein
MLLVLWAFAIALAATVVLLMIQRGPATSLSYHPPSRCHRITIVQNSLL